MEFDAVILAGGRSSRLGGAPKAELLYDGATLLDLAVQAARGARTIAVVGPHPGTLPAGVLNCREEPPFAGPAAAIAAGLSALEQDYAARRLEGPAPLTLVLACDMPRVDAAVRALHAALEQAGTAGRDGVMAVSADGRKQPLTGFYHTAALQRSAAEAAHRGALKDASVFALLANLDVRAVRVPSGSTDDVDTWDDASALGVTGPIQGNGPGDRSGAPAAGLDFGGKR